MEIKKFESINVVPFIDIMLVLLVIVLTTASFVAKGVIPVDLAKSRAADSLKLKKELVITLKNSGELYLNKTSIPKMSFETELLEYAKSSPVFINADKDVPFERFVFLLDTLKKHEYKNVGVITKDE